LQKYFVKNDDVSCQLRLVYYFFNSAHRLMGSDTGSRKHSPVSPLARSVNYTFCNPISKLQVSRFTSTKKMVLARHIHCAVWKYLLEH